MKYFLVVFVLFLSACSIKNYEHTSAKIVIIKSPKIKFSDIGYVRHTKDAIELELFVAGHVYKRIHINHLICVDNGCMSKSSFNQEYLSGAYPSSLLQNIILAKEIYNGKNSLKQDDGFIQRIKTSDVTIKYIVNSREIYFKDMQNHILIKIKEVN
ncbi:hypothetical protein [Sulfurimonas autotrophica]|uniref:Putative lipoprotein n=1 Tax=Sulfurimonas autotrophica (strain ATCC BAA-671 / DSM 16294 / JCM 11897 / OK10) TaxID=563040 RepID=E0UQL1_SULAO|nr:hypothetical protein [Sulfurimonas autotrophica]ADN09883.1 putative lipoprotein [Sulfurimonas autotrophica DSM 16294]